MDSRAISLEKTANSFLILHNDVALVLILLLILSGSSLYSFVNEAFRVILNVQRTNVWQQLLLAMIILSVFIIFIISNHVPVAIFE
jgi:hypothetical protein